MLQIEKKKYSIKEQKFQYKTLFRIILQINRNNKQQETKSSYSYSFRIIEIMLSVLFVSLILVLSESVF